MPVAVLLIVSLAVGVIWWNWEEIAKRPGVEWGLELLHQQPLPTAPARQVSIAVAHLDKDIDQERENMLIDELRTIQSDSAEVERVDRTVEWPNAQTKASRKRRPRRKRAPS